jgi:hypothetical protein
LQNRAAVTLDRGVDLAVARAQQPLSNGCTKSTRAPVWRSRGKVVKGALVSILFWYIETNTEVPRGESQDNPPDTSRWRSSEASNGEVTGESVLTCWSWPNNTGSKLPASVMREPRALRKIASAARPVGLLSPASRNASSRVMPNVGVGTSPAIKVVSGTTGALDDS